MVINSKEREILRLIAEGYRYKEIAVECRRTFPAIRFDIREMMVKMEARSGAHAVAIAFRRGVLL